MRRDLKDDIYEAAKTLERTLRIERRAKAAVVHAELKTFLNKGLL